MAETDALKQNEWRSAMNELIASHRDALATIVATLATKELLDQRLISLKDIWDGEHTRVLTRVDHLEKNEAKHAGGEEAVRLSRAQFYTVITLVGTFYAGTVALLIFLLS